MPIIYINTLHFLALINYHHILQFPSRFKCAFLLQRLCTHTHANTDIKEKNCWDPLNSHYEITTCRHGLISHVKWNAEFIASISHLNERLWLQIGADLRIQFRVGNET